MKKYFLTLCLIILPLLSYAENFSGWITQPVYPVDGALFCSYFISPTTGWIGGEKGIIIRTDDGGDTWEMQDSGTMESIRGIYFINDKKGWAVDVDGQILSSTDGGRKWTIQNKTNLSPRNVQFFSEKEWLIGGLGIHRTTDSGKTWKSLQFNSSMPSEPAILSMSFVNPQIGWFLIGDTVYRTTDGSRKWQESRLPIPKIPNLSLEGNRGDIYFISEQTGWAVIGTRLLFKTQNGGKSWEFINAVDSYAYIDNLIFFDEMHGCISSAVSLFCTDDGGKTFREKIKGHTDENLNFSFSKHTTGNPNTGWVVGSISQIAKTDDAGKTWQMKSKDDSLSFPTFIDAKNGYYYSENRIEGTKDGGKTRKTLYKVKLSETERIATKIPGRFFLNEKVGWVGWVEMKEKGKTRIPHSLVLYTNDGGENWEVQYNEPGRKVNDIFFIGDTVGWAVGSEGLVLHTIDAGKTWVRQKTNIKGYMVFTKVLFINEQKGWIVGEQKNIGDDFIDYPSGKQSIIFHTNDGGKTWGLLSKIRENLLEKIIYLNEKNIWMSARILGSDSSGDMVNLLYSQDGGKTWKQKYFDEINNGTLFFKDGKNGVLLGDKGLMYISNDGGKTWNMKRQSISKEPWDINSVFLNK